MTTFTCSSALRAMAHVDHRWVALQSRFQLTLQALPSGIKHIPARNAALTRLSHYSQRGWGWVSKLSTGTFRVSSCLLTCNFALDGEKRGLCLCGQEPRLLSRSTVSVAIQGSRDEDDGLPVRLSERRRWLGEHLRMGGGRVEKPATAASSAFR